MRGKTSADFWRKVRCLVIDEISMVDAEFLDWRSSMVGVLTHIYSALYKGARRPIYICVCTPTMLLRQSRNSACTYIYIYR